MAIIRAYLTLIGDNFELETITRQLCVEPEYLRTPDEILGNGNLFGHTEWGIETGKVESDDVETVIKAVLSRVEHCKGKMLEVAKQASAEWTILVYIKSAPEDFPYIIFESETLCFMAEIGAHLGIDPYIYDDEEEVCD